VARGRKVILGKGNQNHEIDGQRKAGGSCETRQRARRVHCGNRHYGKGFRRADVSTVLQTKMEGIHCDDKRGPRESPHRRRVRQARVAQPFKGRFATVPGLKVVAIVQHGGSSAMGSETDFGYGSGGRYCPSTSSVDSVYTASVCPPGTSDPFHEGGKKGLRCPESPGTIDREAGSSGRNEARGNFRVEAWANRRVLGGDCATRLSGYDRHAQDSQIETIRSALVGSPGRYGGVAWPGPGRSA